MALFTDGIICDQEVLREYESSILEVARTEELELTPKLRLAQREIGFELITFLRRHGSEFLDLRRGLTNLAVTEPLRHWHAVHSLAAVYRDAYFRHLSDRFREKWQQYSLLAREAKHNCFSIGLGIVLDPVAKPDAPVWELVQGGSLPKRKFLAAAAVVRGGCLSAASEPVTVEADAGTMARLRLAADSDADGWVPYAGTGMDTLLRQAAVALPVAEVWQEEASGIATVGEGPSGGQFPDLFVRAKNTTDRG